MSKAFKEKNSLKNVQCLYGSIPLFFPQEFTSKITNYFVLPSNFLVLKFEPKFFQEAYDSMTTVFSGNNFQYFPEASHF